MGVVFVSIVLGKISLCIPQHTVHTYTYIDENSVKARGQ